MMAERLGPPLDEPIFDELAIIGVGLIGSSVARAVRRRRAARRIVVADRSAETLERARALGLGEEATDDMKRAVGRAEHDAISALDRSRQIVGRFVAEAQRSRSFQGLA